MSLPKNATLSLTPFKIAIPQADIDDFKKLLHLSRLPPATFEGSVLKSGVTDKWMKETKAYWESSFDWRKHEAEINKIPQYTAVVKNSDGREYTIHFIGVFSENPDAVPLLLLHGWPGSFVEFMDIVTLLSKSTAPAFHIIVPSMPGYMFSTQPPLDKDFGVIDVAYIMNELMVGLGFGEESTGGYVAQGGDIGSVVAGWLQSKFKDCRAIHLNAFFSTQQVHPTDDLEPIDLAGLQRGSLFHKTGMAYAQEHATRPSTIGHVIASSPLALLAWVGEKLLEWTDESPPLEKILQLITLWWFTETFPRAIYPYRALFSPPPESVVYKKPIGYSLFPKELIPTPRKWVEAETGDKLVWFRRSERGGHFAAMEVPELLAQDLSDFVKQLGLGGCSSKS